MYPILLSIGVVHIFSFSVFLIIAWCVFSFVLWRLLRDQGVSDEHIFDMTFYATLVALIASRIGFVFFHPDLFGDSPLKVVSLWIQPGLSLIPALVGGTATMILLVRSYKIRIATLLDALAFAWPVALLFGFVGSLLDGAEIGKTTNGPMAVRYLGHLGLRHPVQFYEVTAILIILVFLVIIRPKAKQNHWPYGVLGLWFFLLFSASQFGIEFIKESSVYWARLSANQWMLIAIFTETVGAFYVRGGGREYIQPRLRKFISTTRSRIRHTYDAITSKFTRGTSKNA